VTNAVAVTNAVESCKNACKNCARIRCLNAWKIVSINVSSKAVKSVGNVFAVEIEKGKSWIRFKGLIK
jgi:hypothetical protein